jgi:regulatory protein
LRLATELDEATVVELAAVKLLSSREHSRQELRRKLVARHRNGELVDGVLDGLERRGLLSDARFVENFVMQRSRKGYGPLRIRAELTERGVDGEVMAEWLGQGQIDWGERLDEAAIRKFGDTVVEDAGELARRGRFLGQRGFPISLIRRYLDRVRHF